MKAIRAHGALVVFGCLTFIGAAFATQPTVILEQPVSQQAYAGSTTGFVVLATGDNLRYQWSLNSTNLPAQTNASLILASAQPANTGSYSVKVIGSGGFVQSSIVRLEVNERSAPSMPVGLSGWNQLVILSTSYPHATEYFDDSGYDWFVSGFDNNADGLPASGGFTSAINAGVIFHFQSYFSNNVLRLDSSLEGTSAILTLDKPAAYKSLSILAASGLGSGDGRVVLNFVDGTASASLAYAAYDWHSNGPVPAITGLGRVYYDGSEWLYQNGGTGFGMFETDLDLTGLGLDGKKIASISFSKSPIPQVTGVFAVSGAVNPGVNPSPTQGQTVNLTVSGNGNPWLAGMTNGTITSGEDIAPYQSPTPVSGLPLRPGDVLSFLATGGVANDADFETDSPEGDWSDVTSHQGGAQNGIANLLAPLYSLVGVFLGPGQPNLSPAPAELTFNPSSSGDYGLIEPGLKQVFFVGDGLTSLLTPHHIVIPHSATRLFLGVMDTNQWFGNQGSFNVSVSEINPVNLTITREAGGEVVLSINATTTFTNLVQSLDDLSTTNWATLTNLTVTTSPYQFSDTFSVPAARRFYRVIQSP